RKFRKVTMLQRSFDNSFLRKKRFVVDDGSSDGTATVAQAAGALVMTHDKNKGKGAAVRAALKYAAGNGFDALVLLDGERVAFMTNSAEPRQSVGF
ncbi:MAG: glycosyltransferase, partial [Candidatus Methanospirareceae archaeon]